MTTTSARQQQRRRTAAQWTSENPTLAVGEIGVEIPGGSYKIGDGSSTWTALPYASVDLQADDPTEIDIDYTGDLGTIALLDSIQRILFNHRTGQYYYQFANDGTPVNQTMTQDILALMPVPLSAGTVDRIGCEVSTAVASGVVRLGIYTDNDDLPSNLIAEATSTADASTTGIKDLTISAAIPVNGVYWLAAVAQGAATVGLQAQSGGRGAFVSLPLGTSAPGGTNTPMSRTQSSVTGALPSTISSLSNTPSLLRPRLHFRYA